MLHGIGFFIESLRDTQFPAPQELVVDDARLPTVADYLDRGCVHKRYRGYSWCRVCGDCAKHMGSAELTDGVWLWPEGLSHYVRHHSVGLPEPFITHALASPPLMHAPADAVADCTRWVEWARPLRSPTLRDAIALAQAEDDRLAAIARAERIAANQAKYGESAAPCIWARCTERALRGLVFCSHHLPEMSDAYAFHPHSQSLLRKALWG